MLDEHQQVRFTKLWTDAQPTVNRYISSLVRDQWAARDIVQNTSLVLLRKFPEYDELKPFIPWAIGLAKFEILAHHRDTARNRLVCDSEFIEQYTLKWSEMAPQMSDEATALRICISELNGRPRKIVRLRYAEGKTSEAIASELNLSAANVRTILKRTREALRRCIGKQIALQGGAR